MNARPYPADAPQIAPQVAPQIAPHPEPAPVDLSNWDPTPDALSGVARGAIVFSGLTALGRALLGILLAILAADSQRGSPLELQLSSGWSFLTAAFFVWATVGLQRRKANACSWVIRAHLAFAVLGGINTIYVFAKDGARLAFLFALSPSLWLAVVAFPLSIVVFHVVGWILTRKAREEFGVSSYMN